MKLQNHPRVCTTCVVICMDPSGLVRGLLPQVTVSYGTVPGADDFGSKSVNLRPSVASDSIGVLTVSYADISVPTSHLGSQCYPVFACASVPFELAGEPPCSVCTQDPGTRWQACAWPSSVCPGLCKRVGVSSQVSDNPVFEAA